MRRPRDKEQVRQIINTLRESIDEAEALRQQFRRSREPGRKRGDPAREKRIKQQLQRMRTAMEPVRSEINRSAWYPVAGDLEGTLRHTSKRAQLEAKKLRKLLVS